MGPICFYVFGFPPDFSGATLQALYTAEHLKKRGVDSFFLTYTYKAEHLDLKEHNGFPVLRFLRKADGGLLAYHLNLFYQLFKNRSRFSILYINGNDGQFWTVFWAVIFCKFFSKKLHMELNMDIVGSDPLSIIGTSFEGLKMSLAQKVSCYLSNSTAITKNFVNSYPDFKNIETVFYGTDTTFFKKVGSLEEKLALRTRLGLPLDSKIAMTCGGISKRKGIDFLLDCWEDICEGEDDNCYLVIVGPYDKSEGYEQDFIEGILERTKTPHFKKTVLLTGKVDNVFEYMKASDYFLFCSRQEGSPSVIREAMSSALPVVSLNLPDITEDLIDHEESGLIIYLKDYANLANFNHEVIRDDRAKKSFVAAVKKLLHDPSFAKKIGNNARKKVIENYAFDIKLDKLAGIFK